MDEYEHQANDSDAEKPSTRISLSHHKSAWTGLQSNRSVRGEKHGLEGVG